MQTPEVKVVTMAVMESFVRCGSESRLRCPCCQNVVSTSHMDFMVILSVFPDYTERKCRFCRTYSKKKFYIYYIQHVADSNRHHLWSSSSLQLVIRRTRLSTIRDPAFRWLETASGTVCRLFRTASKLTFSPDHFLTHCSWFLHCDS